MIDPTRLMRSAGRTNMWNNGTKRTWFFKFCGFWFAILVHHPLDCELEFQRTGPGNDELSMHRILTELFAERVPEFCGPKVGQAPEPVWQLTNLCRARLQPCRKVCRMNSALAAGLLGIELPHRLFSLSGVAFLRHK